MPRRIGPLMQPRVSSVALGTMFAISFCGFLFSGPVRAEPSPAATVSADGPVILPLPQADGEIWIEIGNIDVTEFAGITADALVIDGFAPLPPGPHIVTIYLATGSGYEVLSEYEFVVKSALDFSNTGAVEISADNSDGPDAEVMDIYGTAEVRSADGSARAELSYLGSSGEANRINGNAFDIGDYLIELRQTGRFGDTTQRLGHHQLSPGALLVDDRERRGLSFGYASPAGRFGIAAFAARATDALGTEDFLGLDDPDDRIEGLSLSWRPAGTGDLSVSLAGYRGRGVTYFSPDVGDGRGLSLAVDGSGLEGRLRYGLSLARGGWDDDGDLPVFDDIWGNAARGHVAFDLQPDPSGAQLSLGANFALVDYYYYSHANADEATGIERYEVSLDRAGDSFAQRLRFATQTDAREAPDIVPRNRVNEIEFEGLWIPPDLPGGMELSFGLSRTWQDRLETPEFAPPARDYAATTGFVGIAGAGEVTSWSARLSLIDEDDRTPDDLDEHRGVLDLGLTHALAPNLVADASASLTGVRGAAGDWQNADLTLGMTWDVDPGKWALGLEAAATRTNEPQVDDGSSFLMQATYRLTDRSDVVLSASRSIGSYADEDDTTFGFLLRLSLDAPRE